MDQTPVEAYNTDPNWKASHTHWARGRQEGHPTGRPDFVGISGFGWNITLAEEAKKNGALASILLEAPWYSPVFQAYLLTAMTAQVSLSDQLEVSHEFYVHAVMPATPLPDIHKIDVKAPGFHYHETPCQFLQLPLPDDGHAQRIAGVLAQMVVDGFLSPDMRYADQWALTINSQVQSMGTLQ